MMTMDDETVRSLFLVAAVELVLKFADLGVELVQRMKIQEL